MALIVIMGLPVQYVVTSLDEAFSVLGGRIELIEKYACRFGIVSFSIPILIVHYLFLHLSPITDILLRKLGWKQIDLNNDQIVSVFPFFYFQIFSFLKDYLFNLLSVLQGDDVNIAVFLFFGHTRIQFFPLLVIAILIVLLSETIKILRGN